MEEQESRAETVKLLGGCPCLDFVNTVDWRTSDHPRELLTTYADLVKWSAHARILSFSQARRIMQEASRRPTQARKITKRAIALREALYRIFSEISREVKLGEKDMAGFNAELSLALTRSQIVPAGKGFAWAPSDPDSALDCMLWAVVRDAADLLTSEALARVGECAGDGCGWLFLDTSKNRSRQWCSMDDCGNRAKARRFYRKKRATGVPL
jgi:predicted RNA-binding Zn ribbon-like protein